MNLLELYITIGQALALCLLIVEVLNLVSFIKLVCTVKDYHDVEWRPFGMPPLWEIEGRESPYASIGVNFFVLHFVLAVILLFLWLPALALGVPAYLIHSAREKLE